MKTYEQMAADVLRRRNESLAAQAKKNSVARRVALAASICIVTLGVTAGVFGGMILNRSDSPAGTSEPTIGITTNPPENSTNPPEISTKPPEISTKPPEITVKPPVSGVFWNDVRVRNDTLYTMSEGIIEWGWEEMTDTERYTEMEFDGKTYSMMGTVKNYLGEWLASGEAYGYAWDQDNARYGIPCEIYSLTFSPDHRVVAVQFKGQSEIYRFERKDPYDPPATFGELMNDYNLPEVLSLTTPCHQPADSGWPSKYALSDADSDTIWDMLKKYQSAPFEANYVYRYNGQEDIRFSITSEVLGVQGHAFTINDDGYIFTDVTRYGYYYYIGVDAAREIIDYVKAHITEPLPEPQTYQIIGEITEICDGYIKVDDSIMMKNPSDGLVFTIVTEEKSLSRVVEHLLRVGDHVLISYDGRVNEENPLLVETAASIQKVWIDEQNGNVLIPE